MVQQFHFWEYIRRKQNANLKTYVHPLVTCSVFPNSQDTETTHLPIDE